MSCISYTLKTGIPVGEGNSIFRISRPEIQLGVGFYNLDISLLTFSPRKLSTSSFIFNFSECSPFMIQLMSLHDNILSYESAQTCKHGPVPLPWLLMQTVITWKKTSYKGANIASFFLHVVPVLCNIWLKWPPNRDHQTISLTTPTEIYRQACIFQDVHFSPIEEMKYLSEPPPT